MADVTVYEEDELCRSCSKPIIWAVTEKRLKDMPVNAVPQLGGNLLLQRRDGKAPIAVVVDAAHAFGRTDLHLSHFADCPQADKWRRRG